MSRTFAVLGPDEARKLAIWRMCTPIPPHDANEWGICAGGKVVRYSKHGDRSSPYGWEMDHYPIGGTDDIANLRPLHWSLNSSHGGLLSAAG